MKFYIFFIAFFANRGSSQDPCPSGSPGVLVAGSSEWDHSCSDGYSVFRAHDLKFYCCAYPIGYLWSNMHTVGTERPPAEYLPTDHADITTQLKTCQVNKDCGMNEFCGDVMNHSYDWRMRGKCSLNGNECKFSKDCMHGLQNGDYCEFDHKWIYAADLNPHFCYKCPEITGTDGDKSQYVLRSTERNLVFCEKDTDCVNEEDKTQLCYLGSRPTGKLWSEYVPNPDPEIIGKRIDHVGICVQAKPLSYMFSLVYNNLPATDKQGDEGKKYLAVDYELGKHREQLKKCAKNAECSDNQFCGNIISLSAIPDSVNSFCFAVPEIAAPRNADSKYIILPESLNFVTCMTLHDCISVGTDGNAFCLIQTGQSYKTIYEGQQAIVRGLCAEAKPIAYILSHIFENLAANEQQGDEGKKYFPVGYESEKYLADLKKCTKNSECLEKQFCGNIISFTDLANFDKNNAFCFAVPEVIAPHNSNTKYTVLPESLNLVTCDNNEDCRTGGTDANSFCHTGTGHQYARNDDSGSRKKLYKGLCAEAVVCDTSGKDGQLWNLGGVSVTNTCDKNADCDGGGNTKIGDNAQESFENTCVKEKTLPGINLCCYRKTERCKYGKVVNEALRCGRNVVDKLARDGAFVECYGGLEKVLEQNERLDTWCDVTIEQCWQDPAIGFCPDGQTPLFNEPKCSGYNESDPSSGECPATGAMCQLGHCCPKAKINSTGELIKPEYSYQTNQACQPGIRPPQFLGGYCDPDSGMVVITGNLSTDGIPLTLSDSLKTCQTDAECSTNYTKLCIYEESTPNSIAHCYHNPKVWKPPRDEDSVMLIIIIVLIFLIVFGLAALTGFVFYKLKIKNGKNKKVEGNKATKTPITSTTSKSTSNTGITGSVVSPSII